MTSPTPPESFNPGMQQQRQQQMPQQRQGQQQDDEVDMHYVDASSASEPDTSEYDASSADGVESQVAVTAERASTSAGPQRQRKKQYAISTRWEREVAANGLPRDFHSYFCCCARRIGNMFILLALPNGSPVLIAGPCWPFCVVVTLPLILGISFCVTYFVVLSGDLPSWTAYVYFPVLGFALLALCCVSCGDPGLMERVVDEEAGEGGWFWNEQVGSFRPPGALYCRECGVLIQDYDHLCPWTGTGIGRGNMLAFKAFVIGVNVLCYVSIILSAWFLLDGIAS